MRRYTRVIAAVAVLAIAAVTLVALEPGAEARPSQAELRHAQHVEYVRMIHDARLTPITPDPIEEARTIFDYETLVAYNAIQDAIRSVVAYVSAVIEQQRVDAERAAEEARAAQARTQAVTVSNTTSGSGGCASGGGALDGAPMYVIQRESGGNYCARNPSGACGAYQIMPGTWNGFGGYASACDAPPAVQDEKAKTMAACNWQPPNYCAG